MDNLMLYFSYPFVRYALIVGVLISLCATRKCLLLDEPVSGLDPKAAAQMYEIIRQLHQEGITIIMISHDLESALNHATHVLHIGKELFFGTKEAYLRSGIGRSFLPKEGNE